MIDTKIEAYAQCGSLTPGNPPMRSSENLRACMVSWAEWRMMPRSSYDQSVITMGLFYLLA